MSIASKLQALLTASNNTTGETDTTLTAAVQRLIDGYGQGGGGGLPTGISEISTGTYTPATSRLTGPGRAKEIEHGLSAPAKWVVMWDEDGEIQTSYGDRTAFSGYGIVTGNYRVGESIAKDTGGANIGSGYIEGLQGGDVGSNGGIKPDYTATSFAVVWATATYCIAGHTYRWISGR